MLCSPRKAGGPESPPALASSREEEKFPCEYDVGARGSSAVKAHSRLLCPFLLWLRRDSYYSGSESSLTPLGALLHGPSAAKGQSEQPKGLQTCLGFPESWSRNRQPRASSELLWVQGSLTRQGTSRQQRWALVGGGLQGKCWVSVLTLWLCFLMSQGLETKTPESHS